MYVKGKVRWAYYTGCRDYPEGACSQCKFDVAAVHLRVLSGHKTDDNRISLQHRKVEMVSAFDYLKMVEEFGHHLSEA